MGFFSTIFGIGKKAFVPLVNLGKKAYTALSGIGRKIGSFFGRGGMKVGQSGKEVVKGAGQVGKADLRTPMAKAQMGIFKPPTKPSTFNPQGNVHSRGGGLFPPPSGNTPF